MEWQPLNHNLVVEVQFDHFAGGRLLSRHEVLAMASGQNLRRLHDGSGETRKPLGLDIAVTFAPFPDFIYPHEVRLVSKR